MGAEQIGFLLRGPRTLDPKLRSKAVTIGWLAVKNCREIMKKTDWETTEAEWIETNANGDACQVETTAGFSKKNVQVVVDNVYNLWDETITARDTCQRVDPFDDTMALFFAGSETWGDTPDGFGYAIMQAASRLKFLNILGIR